MPHLRPCTGSRRQGRTRRSDSPPLDVRGDGLHPLRRECELRVPQLSEVGAASEFSAQLPSCYSPAFPLPLRSPKKKCQPCVVPSNLESLPKHTQLSSPSPRPPLARPCTSVTRGYGGATGCLSAASLVACHAHGTHPSCLNCGFPVCLFDVLFSFCVLFSPFPSTLYFPLPDSPRGEGEEVCWGIGRWEECVDGQGNIVRGSQRVVTLLLRHRHHLLLPFPSLLSSCFHPALQRLSRSDKNTLTLPHPFVCFLTRQACWRALALTHFLLCQSQAFAAVRP